MPKYSIHIQRGTKFNPVEEWRKSTGTYEAKIHRKPRKPLHTSGSGKPAMPAASEMPLPIIEAPAPRLSCPTGATLSTRRAKQAASATTQLKALMLLAMISGAYAGLVRSENFTESADHPSGQTNSPMRKPGKSSLGELPAPLPQIFKAGGTRARPQEQAVLSQSSRLRTEARVRTARHSGESHSSLLDQVEHDVVAAVVLDRTQQSFEKTDTLQLKLAFKRLALAWQSGEAEGEDPCQEVARQLAAAKGLHGEKAGPYVEAAASILRAKYGVLQAKSTPDTDFDEVFGHELPKDPMEAFEKDINNVLTSVLSPERFREEKRVFEEATRSFDLDPLTKVPIRVSELSLEEIADSYYMSTLYPEKDKAGRKELIRSAYDRLGIDTAFPFGSLHAMSTVVKRLTGKQYDTSEVLELVQTFASLSREFPANELKLHAAWYIGIEKGWPELKLDDPVKARDELVSSFQDSLRMDTTPQPVFVAEIVALQTLMEKTALSFAELVRKSATYLPPRPQVHPIYYWNFLKGQWKIEPSILEEFLATSEDGSDDYYFRTKEKQLEMRRAGTAYTSRTMTVKDKNGQTVELKPFEILEEARKQFEESLPSNPWVQAAARSDARETSRRDGKPPSMEEIERSKAKIIRRLRPTYQHAKNLDKLRNWFTKVGKFGALLRIPYLLSDLIDGISEGDLTEFYYNSPGIGNACQFTDAIKLLEEGRTLEAIDTAMAAIPDWGEKWQIGSSIVKGNWADAGFGLAGMGKKNGGRKSTGGAKVPGRAQTLVKAGKPIAKVNGISPGWGVPNNEPDAEFISSITQS